MINDKELSSAVQALEETVRSQWRETGQRFKATDQKIDLRCDGIAKQVEGIEKQAYRTDNNVQRLVEHVLESKKPTTSIDIMSPDNRQFADRGGSNSHNNAAVLKWMFASVVVIVIAAMSFTIGGKFSAEKGDARINIEQTK